VGRAGRYGTKGLAITFATTEEDKNILNEIQGRFEIEISKLPDSIDERLYSTQPLTQIIIKFLAPNEIQQIKLILKTFLLKEAI
jgi:superfamily II DNA/RNA helicase